MSLENSGVWAAGVWATTVWADGVWREDGSVSFTTQLQSYEVDFHNMTISISDVWTDKISVSTTWSDQSAVNTIWTDK